MAIKCEEIMKYMKDIAPEYLAEPWDNVGLLVGDKNSNVEKILVSLDATNDVINEAIEIGANLIITHHPLSISHMKKVTSDILGGRIYKLIKNNIGVYSAHTNFDVAFGGTNDILAETLGIKNIEILEPSYESLENKKKSYGIGRIGTLENEISLSDYAEIVKSKLNISAINVVGDISKKIKKVAVCAGSGCDYLEMAIKKGADLYICGDVKYHKAKEAEESGICWIDATHYASEIISIPVLIKYLQNKNEEDKWNIEIVCSQINGQPFTIL